MSHANGNPKESMGPPPNKKPRSSKNKNKNKNKNNKKKNAKDSLLQKVLRKAEAAERRDEATKRRDDILHFISMVWSKADTLITRAIGRKKRFSKRDLNACLDAHVNGDNPAIRMDPRSLCAILCMCGVGPSDPLGRSGTQFHNKTLVNGFPIRQYITGHAGDFPDGTSVNDAIDKMIADCTFIRSMIDGVMYIIADFFTGNYAHFPDMKFLFLAVPIDQHARQHADRLRKICTDYGIEDRSADRATTIRDLVDIHLVIAYSKTQDPNNADPRFSHFKRKRKIDDTKTSES
jgi:hypothetical protein